MINGRDISVLAKLCVDPGDWTIRGLADEMGIPPAGVQRTLKKLEGAGMYFPSRTAVAIALARELFVGGVRFLAPPVYLGEARGIRTAWSAMPLSARLVSKPGRVDCVWPFPAGDAYGIALKPLDPCVPGLALKDQRFGELMALIDALRTGGAREREVATALIDERLAVDSYASR